MKNSNGEDVVVMSLGFYHEPLIVENRKYDPKVKNTILQIITDFFENNKEMSTIYICSTSDGYGRHRRITFNKWYKEVDVPIEKFDCREAQAKEGLYASFFIRSDNQLKDYYVDAFYRSIDEYFPADNEYVAA
ncbi:DUF6169 family protein [Chitinophaga sp. YR573]|uniref:DUF6169 family protein n=1 Tax=Chitinophaga sp. YR573 TaxID=1881040 RepID=UPI00115FB64B|nr:DUF6169 family protein [Chitinophaga sp. YR573]